MPICVCSIVRSRWKNVQHHAVAHVGLQVEGTRLIARRANLHGDAVGVITAVSEAREAHAALRVGLSKLLRARFAFGNLLEQNAEPHLLPRQWEATRIDDRGRHGARLQLAAGLTHVCLSVCPAGARMALRNARSGARGRVGRRRGMTVLGPGGRCARLRSGGPRGRRGP